MNVTTPRLIAAYIAGPAVAVGITMAGIFGIPAAANTLTSEPTQALQQIEEDDPGWDWAADGNTCRGVGTGAVECADPSKYAPLTPGVWTFVDESSTWVFCPVGRSGIECGA